MHLLDLEEEKRRLELLQLRKAGEKVKRERASMEVAARREWAQVSGSSSSSSSSSSSERR